MKTKILFTLLLTIFMFSNLHSQDEEMVVWWKQIMQQTYEIDLHPDSLVVVTGANSIGKDVVTVWDFMSGDLIKDYGKMPSSRETRFSPTGKYIGACYDGANNKLTIINCETDSIIFDHFYEGVSFAFSPDETTIALNEKGKILFYDIESRELIRTIDSICVWSQGFWEVLPEMEFTPDGKYILSPGKFINLETEKVEYTYPAGGIWRKFAMSKDGKRIAYITGDFDGKEFAVMDVETKEILNQNSFPYRIEDLSFSDDGNYLLITQKELIIFDVNSNEIVHNYSNEYLGRYMKVAKLTPDNNYILAFTSASIHLFKTPMYDNVLEENLFPFGLIYPNPSNNILTIENNNPTEIIQEINISDLTGQIVFTMPFPEIPQSGNIDINTSELPSGTYNLSIMTGQNIYVQQIIIIH